MKISYYMFSAREWIKLHLIQVVLFLSVSLSIILHSYVFGYYISPDSTNYMHEALALLSGHGFNMLGPNGGYSYFSHFPIGYPLCIALVTFLTQTNVYLASKILTLLTVLLIHIIFYYRFKSNAWVFCLITINYQFLNVIFRYTWSEQLFILGLIWLAFSVYDIMSKQTPNVLNYLSLGLSAVFVFMIRYLGGFSIGVIGLLGLVLGYQYLHTRTKIDLKKVIFTFGTCAFSSLCIGLYLLHNYIHTGQFIRSVPSINPMGIVDFVKAVIYTNVQQMQNVFQIFVTPSYAVSILLWIGFFILICISIFKYRKDLSPILLPLIFITIGGLYILAIFYPCFTQGSVELERYFFPSTILFTIGFIGILLNNKLVVNIVNRINSSNLRYVVAVVICFVLFFTPVYGIAMGNINYESGYPAFEERYLSKYDDVSFDSSLVLWTDENMDNKHYKYLRPDLTFLNPSDTTTYTHLQSIFEKYQHVYVDTDAFNQKLSKYSYDASIVDAFSTYLDKSIGIIPIK